MNKEQTVKTVGEWAYKAIAKDYQKFTKYENKVLKDKNPHHLHQMRVAMRSLRGTVASFAFAVNLPPEINHANMSKIAKVLGNLRDIDVLQETLISQYQPHILKQEKKSFQTVLKKLQKKRKSAFKQVKKFLNSKQYLKLKNSCKLWLNKPLYQPIADIDIKQILPDLLLPQISCFLLHPGWLLGANIVNGIANFSENNQTIVEKKISLTQEKILHDLRKIVKKTRYNMNLFTSLYDESYDEHLAEIAEIQEILGVIQDCFILESFLQKTLKQNYLQKIPTVYQMLQEKRQQQLQRWQTKQELFLNTSHKQNLRITIAKPL